MVNRQPHEASFGAYLQTLRGRAGLTQEELASRAGLSPNAVGALERGARRRPYPHTVRALADALELSVEERTSLLAAVPKPARTLPGEALSDEASPTSAAIPTFALPDPATSLLGREREREEIASLLGAGNVRLLTLTGIGGVGKTRLAVEVARGARGIFPDGVVFVELAPLADGFLLASTILRSSSQGMTEDTSSREALVTRLREKKLLLVLDNFEHLLEAAPEVVNLVEACPRLVVLATSRAPLRVRGEQEYPVPPLELPSSTRSADKDEVLAEVLTAPSGRLFLERVRAVSPGFRPTGENAGAVAAICWRLAGLPLALELAAAKTRFLDPQTLLSRLDEVLATGGARDLPPRQRTMRATMDWSYDLLTEAEKALSRRLSVFAGSFLMEGAEAVGAEPVASRETGVETMIEQLGQLVEQSLVVTEPGEDGNEARYGMLEPVRQYMLTLLERCGEAEETRRRHAEHYLAVAERGDLELKGPRQVAWTGRLEKEHGNLRAALFWAFEREEYRLGLRLAGALGEFWYMRGYLEEGQRWLQAALTTEAETQEASARARALNWATTIAWGRGDFERAIALGEESLALTRETEDVPGVATALYTVGRAAYFADRLERASALVEEASTLQRASGNTVGLARSRLLLGWVAVAQRDYERAMALREEALALGQKVDDEYTTVLSRALGAFAALGLGDYRRANGLCKEGVRLAWRKNMRRLTAVHLYVSASLASWQERPARSARLWGAAEAIYEHINTIFAPVEHRLFGPYIAAARAQTDEVAWEAAWTEGRAMGPKQAVAYASEEDEASPMPPS